MSTTTKKKTKTALSGVASTKKVEKKKYSETQLNRVIKKLSQEANRNITRKNLMDIALGRL